MPLEITSLGDSALVLRVGDSLGKVVATARQLEAAKIPGVVEIAPAFASVGVFFASPHERANGGVAIRAALREKAVLGTAPKPRVVEVPVCYEPEYGLDLEVVAQHSQLSPNEIALRHARAVYHVRCVGFTPGFPYLSGLPKALATPRRAVPRIAVPPGSVAIGGAQTGIYPLSSPGGWNIIGRTPLQLVNVADAYFPLRTGDRVQFKRIDEQVFRELLGQRLK